jgi:hypothetical protein
MWTDASMHPCACKGQGLVRPGGGIGALWELESRRKTEAQGVDNAPVLSRNLFHGSSRPRSSRFGAHTAHSPLKQSPCRHPGVHTRLA